MFTREEYKSRKSEILINKYPSIAFFNSQRKGDRLFKIENEGQEVFKKIDWLRFFLEVNYFALRFPVQGRVKIYGVTGPGPSETFFSKKD